MPVYQYRCKCGKITEHFYSIKDRTKSEKCSCGGEAKKLPYPEHSHVGVKKIGRSYQRWNGNPADCPKEFRSQLQRQDRPKDRPIFTQET